MTHRLVMGVMMLLMIAVAGAGPALKVDGERLVLDGQEIKLLGLRLSNALISDRTAEELIGQLDTYRASGLNTISVFLMGSRFGDVKGYRPDATMDPVCRKRFERILEAAQDRRMVVIVGCLYWSTSRAKEDLGGWKQVDADRAVANTAKWLKNGGYRHVILDPDNEGMACKAMGWKVESMIRAAHAANPTLVVANNTGQTPDSEDLNMHHGKREAGKPWLDSEATPKNAPGNYWGKFSKESHQKGKSFYNYSRIGCYTEEMKQDQIRQTREGMTRFNGHILASTWIQCGTGEGVGGPFAHFGGRSNMGAESDKTAAWNVEIDRLHEEAGILWWIDHVRESYLPMAPEGVPTATGD